jgi:diguanylate cyclase (GGDEF)-like protein
MQRIVSMNLFKRLVALRPPGACTGIPQRWHGAWSSTAGFGHKVAQRAAASKLGNTLRSWTVTGRRAAERAWNSLRSRTTEVLRARSLIGEILALQLAFAIVVGLLAFGGLWLISSWLIEDNIRKWGEQWISTLDELGMPLYVSDDEDKYLRIEDYIKKFPEISYVRFYSISGEPIHSNAPNKTGPGIPPLTPAFLESIANTHATDKRYVIDPLFRERPLLRISKPIWTVSLMSDGLMGFDPTDEQAVQETLVGYVELGLDFSTFQDQLKRNIFFGSALSAALLALLTIASWFIYRRALMPLSQLQHPLRKLAMGRTNFTVKTSGHKEIVAIAEALNTTVSALKERDKKLWRLANHDSLTGLINRHRFSELLDKQLKRATADGEKSALLFIDLDQFKYVNDTVGHAAGDRLLTQVADQLKSGVRAKDVVARFGGDEFVVLISAVTRKQVSAICEKLVQSIRDYRFVENGDSFTIRCSIGITMIGGDNFTPAELLAQADMACHQAKELGRNRFHFHKGTCREMSQMATEVGWSQQIQTALSQDGFILHFQPIIDVRSGEPAYYEVLLRLKTDKKLVLPDVFLPAANRFGLMADIDQWVIRNSLQKLAEFRSEHGEVQFTVNVSGNIFESPDLFNCMQQSLEANDVPLDAVVLEITEQVAIRNMGNAARQISDLSELGYRFAIDDFGAGYSSYGYLKILPVEFIKIDGEFINNISKDVIDQKIVGSIIEIAKATNKKTIAEHVEDYRTFRLLRDLGVDYAQGYFAGHPSAKLTHRTIPVSIGGARTRKRCAS